MKILIVNDDGIEAPGLHLLANWAKSIGEVLVVAPKFEQSAKSQSIDIRNAFEAAPYTISALPGTEAWAVDSTPADCVRWAISGLQFDADIIFSGINNGYNLGTDILYSATAGAAAEGILFDRKAIAFSTGHGKIDSISADALDKVWKYILEHRMLECGDFWNVNIPPDYTDISVTRQGGHFYRDYFQTLGNNMVKQVGTWVFENHHDRTVDTDAVMDGFISICPLTTVRTDFEVLKKYIY